MGPIARLVLGKNTVPSILLGGSFPGLSFLTCLCWPILNSRVEGTVHRCLEFSLYVVFACLVLCLVNSIFLGFPRHPAPFPQLRETSEHGLGSSSLCCNPDASSRQSQWSSFKERSPSLPDGQCPECHCFICFVWCFRLGRKVNLVLYYSILTGSGENF